MLLMNQEMNHGGIDVFPQRFMLRVARLAQHTMASCCPPGSWPACHWAIGWDAGNVTGMDALIEHRLGSQFGYGFTMVYHSGFINQRSIFSDRLWANNQVYNVGAILRRVVHHPIQRYIILTPVVMCYRVHMFCSFSGQLIFWMLIFCCLKLEPSPIPELHTPQIQEFWSSFILTALEC